MISWLGRTRPFAYGIILILFIVVLVSTILSSYGYDLTFFAGFTFFIIMAISIFTIALFFIVGRRVIKTIKKSKEVSDSAIRVRRITSRVAASGIGIMLFVVALIIAATPAIFTPGGLLTTLFLWLTGDLITSAAQILALWP